MVNSVNPDEPAHSGSSLFAKVHVLVCRAERISKEPYSRLSLSRFPRDSLKYCEISVPRHIKFAEVRKNNSNNHI